MERSFLNKIKNLAFLSVISIIALNASQDLTPVNEFDRITNNFLWHLVDNMSTVAYAALYTTVGALLFHNKGHNIKTKILNIIKYIFIPYLAWQIIISISKITVLHQNIESLNFINTVFFMIPYAPDGPLYHFYLCFFLCIISLVIFSIFKNEKWLKPLVIFLSLASLYLFKNGQIINNLSSVCLFPTSLKFAPAFLLGCYYGKEYKKINLQIIPAIYIFSLVVEGICSGIFLQTIYCSIPFLILSCADIHLKTRKTRYSFLVYAVHPVFVAIICPIIQSMIPSATLANIVNILLVFGFSLFSSWIIYNLIRRVLPFLLPYLTCNKDY